MARNEIQFDLIVGKLDDAKKSIESFANDTKKSLSGLDSVVKGISGFGEIAAVIGVASIALRAFVGVMESAVDAASESEDAINNLNIALEGAGNFSEQTSKSLEDYAKSLQASSKFSDEAILKTSTLIENMTRLDEQGLKKVTKSAINLASQFGKDLDSSATILSKAFNGNYEALKKLGLQFQEGSTKAETFDNILKAINPKAASGQLNTFSGATTQLKNAFDEVLESIGNIIIKNPQLIDTIKEITTKVFDFANEVSNSNNPLNRFLTLILDITTNLAKLAITIPDVFSKVSSSFNTGTQAALDRIKKQKEDLDKMLADLKNKPLDPKGLGFGLKPSEIKVEIDTEKLKSSVATIEGRLKVVGLDDIEKVQERFKETTTTLEEARTAGIIKTQSEFNYFYQKAERERDEALKAIEEKAAEARLKAYQQSLTRITTLVNGILSGIGQGAAGVRSVSSAISNTIADAFKSTPIVGTIVGLVNSIIDFLDQDDVAKKLAEFMQGAADRALRAVGNIAPVIDTFRNNIADNLRSVFAQLIPIIINALADEFINFASDPGQFGFTIEVVSAIIEGIIKGLASAFSNLSRNWDDKIRAGIQKGFIPELKLAALIFGQGIEDSAKNFAAKIGEGAADFVKQLFSKISGIGGGGGILDGGGGFSLPGPLNSFKFAEGGIVPGSSFQGDKVTANVNSGELIVDRSTTEQLKQFLSGASNMTINLVVGEEQLSSVLVNLNRKGFRTA